MPVLLVAGLVAGQLLRPVPEPTLRLTLAGSHTFAGNAPTMPWPTRGQAEVAVDGLGSMGSSGGSAPRPTASVAKVMTAYVFLKNHPLSTGTNGPTFTISPAEAARLNWRKSRGESHVDVVAGQQFTERKALEALMVVSANNIAYELARWDAGTATAFVAKMNATARELGMTSTTYTDPSGYDARTVSTAADQVKLLRAAMRIPAFAEVVSQRTYVPANGGLTRYNGNSLLGQYGVVGGKTGYTDLAGGNFVFAARKRVGGVNSLIVGAVMGQTGGGSAVPAIEASRRLIVAAEGALTASVLARTGTAVAHLDDGLGGRTPLVAAGPVTAVGWPGLTVRIQADDSASLPHQGPEGDRVGAVTVGGTTFPLKLSRHLESPGIMDRLTRLG